MYFCIPKPIYYVVRCITTRVEKETPAFFTVCIVVCRGFSFVGVQDGSDECKTPGGNTHSTGADTMCAISTTAQDYYDSDNAFNFYRQVWFNRPTGRYPHVLEYSTSALTKKATTKKKEAQNNAVRQS